MADHASVIHEFVSTIADLPGSLVKPSDWNHGHKFQGGVNGDVLTFDNSQTDNVVFKSVLTAITGRLITYQTSSQGVTNSTSPTIDMATMNLVLKQSNSTVVIFAVYDMVDALSTFHQGTINIALDANTLGAYNILASAIFGMRVFVLTNLSSGSHNLRGAFTSPNPNLDANLFFYVFEFSV